jgi:16S rRNA (cytosine1402-N4)-methyltransferase
MAPMSSSSHLPVLLSALVEAAAPLPGQRWIDGTFGRGGHSRALLERGCTVLALDRDGAAVSSAKELQECWPQQLHFQQDNFNRMQAVAQAHDWTQVAGILLDLGVSSPQLDEPERGFSFREEGPLDMRMDQRTQVTAADLVNTLAEGELADLLFRLGDEYDSRRIARALVRTRERAPLQTTTQLATAIAQALPRRAHGRVHPATKTFQALRLAVNQEPEALAEALPQALALLAPGGILAVISFHSGEDRYVKHFLRERHRPVLSPAPAPAFAKVQRYLPNNEEIAANSRCRSARLRLGWKLTRSHDEP